MDELSLNQLRQTFGDRLQENVRLSNYTTINIGGEADALLIVNSAQELEEKVKKLWNLNIPFLMLGCGSNVLISDKGLRSVVVINHAHNFKVDAHIEPNTVWAESGAILASVARQVALRGLSGLEWASTIPGTVGGSVYGNAGAFGRDISCNFLLAEILQSKGKDNWQKDQMEYSYRSSILKKGHQEAVILSATFQLEKADFVQIKDRMEEYRQKRMSTQPAGPSMGSVFRNPSADKAARLIDSAGLKNTRIGKAEISAMHANFIINTGGAKAEDVLNLMALVQRTVEEKFNIHLEPEVQVLGDWDADSAKIIKNLQARQN